MRIEKAEIDVGLQQFSRSAQIERVAFMKQPTCAACESIESECGRQGVAEKVPNLLRSKLATRIVRARIAPLVSIRDAILKGQPAETDARGENRQMMPRIASHPNNFEKFRQVGW